MRLQRAQAAEDDVAARLLIDSAEQRADGVAVSELDTDVELALRGGVPAALHRDAEAMRRAAASSAAVPNARGGAAGGDVLDSLPLAVIMGAAAEEEGDSHRDHHEPGMTSSDHHKPGMTSSGAAAPASYATRAAAGAGVRVASTTSSAQQSQHMLGSIVSSGTGAATAPLPPARTGADGVPYARYPSADTLAALVPSRREMLGWLTGPVATQGAHAPDSTLDAASSYASAVHRARRVRESSVMEAGGDMRLLVSGAVDSIARAVVGMVAQDVEEALDSVAEAIAEAV